MKIEITHSEMRDRGSLSRQVLLSAEADAEAETLSRFLELIEAVGWEWLLSAMARRYEQQAPRL